MTLFSDPNLVVLLAQVAGTLLMSALGFVLLRTIGREPLKYWTIAWAALFVALTTLWLSFQVLWLGAVAQPIYLFGEYVFGYMVFAGCRQFATGRRITSRERWLVLPAIVLAIELPWLGASDFNAYFPLHAVTYAYLFFLAFRAIRRARQNPRSVAGLRVMKAALALLAIGYFHYVPLFIMTSIGILPGTLPYLVYSPLYDLMLLVMLMFGMLMVVTGEVQYQLETTNAELAKTQVQLERRAKSDHLTSAFNRHALHALITEPSRGRLGVLRGSAAVVDIDNLKLLNDTHGHVAGDAAIRAVAAAIRDCIRADDLLFRWGGDEFLVLLIGVGEADARTHLATVNLRLRGVQIDGVPEPIDVSVTIGFATFDSVTSLDQVIALADEAMYGRKRAPDGPAAVDETPDWRPEAL